jgi:aspartyl-tRNA(Asn)/glutamyl-tRNA(Gln) amidotransferase subunit C
MRYNPERMGLTSDQIKKVSKLANIPVTVEEEEKYASQLSSVLDYIDQLNSVETSDIEPTYNVTENTNITRRDTESKSLTQEEALGNGPQVKNGLFVTKGVFEE